jgi:hypothetical protein
MKKLAGILIAVVLYTAASWYVGVIGEEKFRQQMAEADAVNQLNGLALNIREYDRGIFFSNINVTMDYVYGAVPEGAAFHIDSHSKVQHGPLLFLRGLGVGLFSSASSIQVVTPDDDINQSLTKLFGDSIGEVVTRGYFNNTYRSTWKIDPVSHDDAESGASIKLDGMSLSVSGRFSDRNLEAGLALGELVITENGAPLVRVSPMNGQFNVEYLTDVVSIGSGDFSIEQIDFTVSGVPGSIEGFSIVQKQQVVNNKIDTSVQFSIARIAGPVEITGFEYNIDMNRLDPQLVEQWMQISNSLNTDAKGDVEAWVANNEQVFYSILRQAKADNMDLAVVIRGNYLNNLVETTLAVTPNELQDGALFTPEGALNWLPMFNSTLRVTAPAAVVEQSMLILMVSQYMGTYIQKEGDNYLFNARVEDSRVFVGAEEIPQEVLAALLAAQAGGEEEYEDHDHGHDHDEDHDHQHDDDESY